MDDLAAFLLPIWVTVLTGYAVICGLNASEPDAPWWLRWPLPIWNAIAHSWRRPAPAPARPDYAKIAMLEHEIFGIEPEPGTSAAAAINLQRAFAPLLRRDPAVCLTKNCAGETTEIRLWSGALARRIHRCEKPE
jgi:hypothetical protein